MTLPVFAWDTETSLIRPGIGAPPMVCLQFQVGDDQPQLVHARDPATPRILEWALTGTVMTGHVVAYDMAVVCAAFPRLIPLVFAAYDADRVTCTRVRAKLIDIALGQFEGGAGAKWGYHLDECISRATKDWPNPIVLDKTDPWRLKYGTLWGTPADQFPPEARHYALGDTVVGQLYRLQEAINPLFLRDQFRQSRAAFWIRLMECRGIRTDLAAVQAYHAEVLEEAKRDRAVAEGAGLVRPDGTRNMKAAMERMVSVMRQLEEPLPLTDTGEELLRDTNKARAKQGLPQLTPEDIWAAYPGKYIKLDEDTCLASGDEVLEAFQRFGAQKTTLGRVERLYFGVHLPLQASFQEIVETGRTSCRMGDVEEGKSPPSWGFQLQNLPRKGRMRDCFIPRAGRSPAYPRLTQEQVRAMLAAQGVK